MSRLYTGKFKDFSGPMTLHVPDGRKISTHKKKMWGEWGCSEKQNLGLAALSSKDLGSISNPDT